MACRLAASSGTLFGMETSTIGGTAAQAGRSTGVPSAKTSAPLSTSKPINKKWLYAALFLVGFALRFGFVLLKHTYVRAPGSILPFGAEICQIAKSIVEGHGYSSPFLEGPTGPTAWIAPVYPLLCAGVFRVFGIYSVASAMVLLFLQCLMAAATGIAIYALGVRTVGARVGLWAAWIWTVSPIFFRWPVSWIWDFTASALLVCVVLIATIDAGEKGTLALWLRMAAIWALIALTNPAPLT